MSTEAIIILTGLLSGLLGSIITAISRKSAAQTASKPDLIAALSEHVERQGERIDKLDTRIKKLEKENTVALKELEHWQKNYFKLFKWGKEFLAKHKITEVIPEFHKESQ